MSDTQTKVDPATFTKLWQLLELGLADLRKQEQAPNSVVDMNEWLETRSVLHGPPVCTACLAGSVLRWTCGMTDLETFRQLPYWADALNELRRGRVGNAAAEFFELYGDDCLIETYLRLDADIVSYSENKDLWHKQMSKLLSDLKAADL